METKHTEGPWELNVAINEDDTLDCGEHERYVLSKNNVLIADCYADTALDLGLPESFGEAQANARLIAAAPELLEELKLALEDLESAEAHVWGDEHPVSPDDCRYCCTRKRIAAAIAKAEGGA